MTGIKICGLKRKEDIEYVNKYMPEYIGFVFAKSRRQVEIEQAKELRSLLKQEIKTVGVFVNESMEKVVETAILCSLDFIQLHGDETPEYICTLKEALESKNYAKIKIWKAVRVKDEESLKNLHAYNVDTFLLDTFVEGSYGGAGKTFDWNLAALAKNYGKIVLAGGLTIENVSNAIKAAEPFAVDISSGVESEGIKDETKIRDFINMVRN